MPSLTPTERVARDCPAGAIRSTEHNGCTYGDQVRLRGERGLFTFLFHHKDVKQEYVELYGPNGLRSVSCERVRWPKPRRRRK